MIQDKRRKFYWDCFCKQMEGSENAPENILSSEQENENFSEGSSKLFFESTADFKRK